MNSERYPVYKLEAATSKGGDCEHCGREIEAGYTKFNLTTAVHNYPDHEPAPCWHWICLVCMGSTIRRWTKEAANSVSNSE